MRLLLHFCSQWTNAVLISAQNTGRGSIIFLYWVACCPPLVKTFGDCEFGKRHIINFCFKWIFSDYLSAIVSATGAASAAGASLAPSASSGVMAAVGATSPNVNVSVSVCLRHDNITFVLYWYMQWFESILVTISNSHVLICESFLFCERGGQNTSQSFLTSFFLLRSQNKNIHRTTSKQK